MTDLRYPTGRFSPPSGALSPGDVAAAILRIEGTPAALRHAVADLSEAQLDTPYRPGGWTVRQLVHHVADSHLNAYVRFKLALTEEHPTIRTYDQTRWAELVDSELPVEPSLRLLQGVHERWIALLRSLPAEDWSRPLHHPEFGDLRLDALLALYAWHGPHHVAHVTALREREGW